MKLLLLVLVLLLVLLPLLALVLLPLLVLVLVLLSLLVLVNTVRDDVECFLDSSSGGALRLRLRLRPSPLHQPEQQRPGWQDSGGARKGCYFS